MSELFLAQKFTPSSPIHIVKASRHGMGVVTFCTGRTLQDAVAVSGTPASCRSCLAKAAREGIDPAAPASLPDPVPTQAGKVKPGDEIRIESGPRAGHVGVVATVTEATQFRTQIRTVILDFADGFRSVRQSDDPVTILRPAR